MTGSDGARKTYPFDPDWCMRPGVHLLEMMDNSGLKGDLGVKAIARLSGLEPKTIQRILSGKQRITKSIAQRLATGTQPLAVSAQMWLNLENTYRKALAAGKQDISDE